MKILLAFMSSFLIIGFMFLCLWGIMKIFEIIRSKMEGYL